MKCIKSFLVFSLITVLIAPLGSAATKSTVTIATYDPNHYEIMRNNLLPKWQDAHPDIDIQLLAVPNAQFWDKMMMVLGTANAPDIIETAGTYLFGHVVRNGAVDLAPYLQKDPVLNESAFWQFPWDETRWPWPDGTGVYALPHSTVGGVLWYNPDLLANAGLNAPASSWTWNDLRDASRKIGKDTNGDGNNEIWGFTANSSHKLYDPLVKSFGGRILSPDRKSSELTSSQAAAATRFLAEWVLQDRSASISASFINGNVGFQIDGSFSIDRILKAKGLNWGVAMVPSGPAVRNTYGGSDMWEVMRRPNQDMGPIIILLKELLSWDTIQAFWASYSMPYSLPSMRTAASKVKPNLIQQVLMQSAEYMSDADWSPDWAQWQTSKSTEINFILRGERSVQEGLLKAKQAVDNVIATTYNIKP